MHRPLEIYPLQKDAQAHEHGNTHTHTHTLIVQLHALSNSFHPYKPVSSTTLILSHPMSPPPPPPSLYCQSPGTEQSRLCALLIS